MKIQISNFYFLSIILLVVSGCQELQELQLNNQSNELIKSSSKKDEVTVEIIAVSEIKKQEPITRKKFGVFENKMDSKNIYQNITNMKTIMKNLIRKPEIYLQNYFKPSIKIKFDAKTIMYKGAFWGKQEKGYILYGTIRKSAFDEEFIIEKGNFK